MPGPPKVSICMLSYNQREFLPAAIDSALAQTYDNLEIIIADDGSSDGSLEIAEAYAAAHPARIRVGTHAGHRNRGIAATANLAFEQATGVYWSVLGSDDVLYPHKVAVQVAFLERHREIGWTYAYAHHIDEHGQRHRDLGLFGLDITRAPDPLERLIRGNAIPAMTVLARRACLERIGREDETLVYSDWHLWIRMLAHARVAFLPRVLVRYRVHAHNMSVGVTDGVRFGRSVEVLTALRGQAAAIGGALARPRTQALLDLQLAYLRYCVRDGIEPAGHLAAAFATDPTLRTDVHYVAEWIASCQRDLTAPASSTRPAFGAWVAANLPGDVDQRVRQAAARTGGGATGFAARRRAALYWQRWHVLAALAGDRRAWRDRELFAVYAEALAGPRVSRQLGRLFG
jgi:alpha-1,3-rhamnosyltransferase